MITYAALKNRRPVAVDVPKRAIAPRALTEGEAARVAENRAFVAEHLPEVVAGVKALYGEGLIEGWRAVACCRLFNERDGHATG